MPNCHQPRGRVNVRWATRRHLPDLLNIEKESCHFPWREEDFLRCMRQRDCFGKIAEADKKTVGFMVYKMRRPQAQVCLLRFAVSSAHRRRGIGSQMMRELIRSLSPERYHRLVLKVSETNLPAQLFLRALGFQAVNILHGCSYNPGEDDWGDAYVMAYSQQRFESIPGAVRPYPGR